MSLKEEIDKEYKNSFKNGNKVAVSILRLLKSEIKNKEVDTQEELSDNEVVKIIKNMVKKSNDAIQQYQAAGRPELAEKEESEKSVLEAFLPKQLTENEIESIVREIISRYGTVSKKDFGKIMKEAISETAGRADGNTVRKIVQKFIS